LYQRLRQRLARLEGKGSKTGFSGGEKGIEKESLRVSRDGNIAQTPHPRALGSALTHPYITTDYSEALLEMITPPLKDVEDAHECLRQIHRYVYSKLGDELLWATSMPCVIAGESSIPIAEYGTSNVGKMKHIYRRGLDYRYGRTMQAIAGVHFNYSLPESFWPIFMDIEHSDLSGQDFISDAYFCLIRNFQRLGWIIPYLFGASPAVCKSFFGKQSVDLAEFDSHTYYGPYATSLRMSDIGYKNNAQDSLNISYNNLQNYVYGLTQAIETPFANYERIGVVVDGEYLQLNANILQIENEYYSFVRPKQVAQSGEKPTLALKRRGVQYVEIRALDVDLFDPVGINDDQMRFIETFLILCLLQDSPPIGKDEQKDIEYNQQTVACCGRDPGIRLRRNGSRLTVQEWTREIYEEIQPIAELLDQGESAQSYRASLATVLPAIEDPDQTPSARMIAEMRENNQSFYHFAMDMCEKHLRYFQQDRNTPERIRFFEEEAEKSLKLQQDIEAADNVSFDKYLHQYFSQS
jgi:glutamate--cysteine ligase